MGRVRVRVRGRPRVRGRVRVRSRGRVRVVEAHLWMGAMQESVRIER